MTAPTIEPSAQSLQLLLDTGRALALKANEHPTDKIRGRPYIIVRDADLKESVQFLDDKQAFRDFPVYKNGRVPLDTRESFSAYFKTHMEPSSRIYANMNPIRFVGVINDHGEDPASADWRDYRVIFEPKHAPEWETWLTCNKQVFKGSVEFAEWLQDQHYDFVDPAGTVMMQIAQSFRVNQSVVYKKDTRLDNGNVEFTWNTIGDGSAQTAAGTVSIPEVFTISIPVWAGLDQQKYWLDAYLRYRLTSAGLSIWYQLQRPHKVLEQAFADLCDSISKETGTTLLFGKPE